MSHRRINMKELVKPEQQHDHGVLYSGATKVCNANLSVCDNYIDAIGHITKCINEMLLLRKYKLYELDIISELGYGDHITYNILKNIIEHIYNGKGMFGIIVTASGNTYEEHRTFVSKLLWKHVNSEPDHEYPVSYSATITTGNDYDYWNYTK